MLTQIGGPEPLRELPEQDERMQKRMNARVGKAQAGCALMAGCYRARAGNPFSRPIESSLDL
jgi:hypothetical protein